MKSSPSRNATRPRPVEDLAHAILNPLNSASLQLSLLEARRSDPELARIRAELARLESVVADFLASSRPDLMRRRTVPTPRKEDRHKP